MSFKQQKIFMECVRNRDVEGVILYKSEMTIEVLKNLRIVAKKRDYDEIVNIIDMEIEDRENNN